MAQGVVAMLSIATWNVNSIKARLPNVLAWLQSAQPDVALLQELKCIDDNFPRLEIEALGYHLAVHGQKSYNGVAILSKSPLENVLCGLPGNDGDDHARSAEHTSELQSLMRTSYAVFCLKKKKTTTS